MGLSSLSFSDIVGQPGWGYPNDWLRSKPILKTNGLFCFSMIYGHAVLGPSQLGGTRRLRPQWVRGGMVHGLNGMGFFVFCVLRPTPRALR